MENDDLNLGCTHSPKKKKIFTHKIEETMSSTYKKRFQDFKMQGIDPHLYQKMYQKKKKKKIN